jgi:hypothetical protein
MEQSNGQNSRSRSWTRWPYRGAISKEWRDVAVKILFRVRPLSLACRGFEALFFTDATFVLGCC